jgi:hypothetical protein
LEKIIRREAVEPSDLYTKFLGESVKDYIAFWWLGVADFTDLFHQYFTKHHSKRLTTDNSIRDTTVEGTEDSIKLIVIDLKSLIGLKTKAVYKGSQPSILCRAIARSWVVLYDWAIAVLAAS